MLLCPACNKEVQMGHTSKPFDIEPGMFIYGGGTRFWICADTAPVLEQMVKTFREARYDELVGPRRSHAG